MLISIIIRTLNEARHLDELLTAIARQETHGQLRYEVVLVDSGSTDDTLRIAEQHQCRILHIQRDSFSFGRSLNIGCQAALGEILVITSGHCVPASTNWLWHLCQPIMSGTADYSYGRQLGGPQSKYSECRIYAKYFPEQSSIPQEGFFCNNANAALSKNAWEKYRFDEELTGLEDMALAQRLVADGGKVAYVAEAAVYHYHYERWATIKRRFEREAIALQQIMPQIHIRKRDLVRYIISSILLDWGHAVKTGHFMQHALAIVCYRCLQYWGSYRGNNDHRRLSHLQKERYFYPQ